MDLKLYNYISTVEFGVQKLVLNEVDTISVSSPTTTRTETIVNKVIKFMMTEYGSNALDTTYGSKWISITQLREEYIPKYILMINADIDRCMSYIKNSEKSLPSTTEKLYIVKFNGLDFSTTTFTAQTQILLNLTIYTTFNNKAGFTLTGA